MSKLSFVLLSVMMFISLSLAMMTNSDIYSKSMTDSIEDNQFSSEVEKLDKAINKQLTSHVLSRVSKRSDIDSRLMELQAKIDFMKAFQNLPAGHGKFDFEKIGKRFSAPSSYSKSLDSEE